MRNLVFFGTADLACPILEALTKLPGWSISAVVTQPDRPKGRDLKLQPTPVKATAARLGLTVVQPERARKPEFLEQLARFAPELIVVAAYGQILPPAVLELPRFGCLNVHTSLLPKYRGAAPIQWALLNGDAQTGVTIMKMDPGLDTGEIVEQETVTIAPEDDAESLHDKLAALGADLLVRTISPYTAGKITPRPQPEEGASYARKIAKEDGHIDWKEPARLIWNRVRAFTPWPGAFTGLLDDQRLRIIKVWQAEVLDTIRGEAGEIISAAGDGIVVACGSGGLRIQRLQREGGRQLSAREFLTGHPLRSGQRLG